MNDPLRDAAKAVAERVFPPGSKPLMGNAAKKRAAAAAHNAAYAAPKPERSTRSTYGLSPAALALMLMGDAGVTAPPTRRP